MLFAVAMDGSLPLTGDGAGTMSGTDVDLAEETEVLVELILGTKGMEGVRGTEVPKGVLGPKGTDLLAAVLVKVELTEALDGIGGARLRSLDVRGS